MVVSEISVPFSAVAGAVKIAGKNTAHILMKNANIFNVFGILFIPFYFSYCSQLTMQLAFHMLFLRRCVSMNM